MTIERLKKLLDKLPRTPGIYIFRNENGKPLYIGKAFNLRNRIKNYLAADDARTKRMVGESEKIDHITADSDIEALILESRYIKQYRPDFNIMLRDDKQYFYVGFTDELFPKVFLTHQPPGRLPAPNRIGRPLVCNYIGPFTDGTAIKTALRLLRQIFPYCICRQTHHNYCLNYHIGKCPGYCCLKKNQKHKLKIKNYDKNIGAIKSVLSGRRVDLIGRFEKEMKKLAKEEKFEEAMELREEIEKLKKVFENARIIRGTQNATTDRDASRTIESLRDFLNLPSLPHRIEAYDVANIHGRHAVGAMIVFADGKPDKREYRRFKITNYESRATNKFRIPHSESLTKGDAGMLKEVLTRRLGHPEWPHPDLMLVDGGKAQLNAAAAANRQIKIIALTKNKKHAGEKIYIAGRKDAILLNKLPPEVKNLLLRINSEAHRFAIGYYRELHRKNIAKKIVLQ